MCSVWGAVHAQQIPQYSQYIDNQYMVNPAAAGSDPYVSLILGGRMQWTGFDNAPKTSYLYFAAPGNKLRNGRMKRTYGIIHKRNTAVKHPTMRFGGSNHCFGAQLLGDQYGPFRTFKIAGTYAYHLGLSRDYRLAFGVNAGLSSRSFLSDKAQVLSVLTNTGYYDVTYSTYAGNQSAQYNLEVDAGIYFYGKGAFVGFSASQLTGDLVKFGNRMTNFDPKIHYILSGSMDLIINRRTKLTVATLMKYIPRAPFSAELTVRGKFSKQFWAGASYRFGDAVVAMFGVEIKNKFRLGYSFDLSVSKLIRYNSGGHEIVLGFMFGRDRSFSSAKY
jgi:type IX secretion system PorP/SprF family membrane protein